MPLGMMNRAMGQTIGNEVRELVEMDFDENGSVVGQFLRIKVKLDITNPLMRGVSLMMGEEDEPVWCLIMYEFLLEFCYMCGTIGHMDKSCIMVEQERGVHQYSKKPRFIPEKKRWDDGALMASGRGRRGGSWHSEASSGEDKGSGGSKLKFHGPSKSNSLSWRKSGSCSSTGTKDDKEEEEVLSPPKEVNTTAQKGAFKEVDGTEPGKGPDSSIVFRW